MWSQQYPRSQYDAIRNKYNAADAYPHLYDKVAMTSEARAAIQQRAAAIASSPVDPSSDSNHSEGANVWRSLVGQLALNKFKFW